MQSLERSLAAFNEIQLAKRRLCIALPDAWSARMSG
jgi:hypothetical protein